jgi:hypothetical protein
MAEGSDPRTSGAGPSGTGPGGAGGEPGDETRERRGQERKERVLHTRISEQLAEDLRRAAEEMRVPVSNLVRNVLEEAFTAVETVTDNMGEWIEEVIGEADRARERLRRHAAERHRSARHAGRRHRRRHEHGLWTRREGAEPEEPAAAAEPASEAESEALAAEPGAAADVPSFPDVLGWQLLVLNAPRTCAADGRPLARGERAFVGLTARGASQTFLCGDCVDRLG